MLLVLVLLRSTRMACVRVNCERVLVVRWLGGESTCAPSMLIVRLSRLIGMSDPYVKVRIGKHKSKRTRVQQKTLVR
jgi:hypothetical protein